MFNREILWHLVNCGLIAALVFLGGISAGNISFSVVISALIASGAAFIVKFKDYWEGEEGEYKDKVTIGVFI